MSVHLLHTSHLLHAHIEDDDLLFYASVCPVRLELIDLSSITGFGFVVPVSSCAKYWQPIHQRHNKTHFSIIT